jgi:hypothetical protein
MEGAAAALSLAGGPDECTLAVIRPVDAHYDALGRGGTVAGVLCRVRMHLMCAHWGRLLAILPDVAAILPEASCFPGTCRTATHTIRKARLHFSLFSVHRLFASSYPQPVRCWE